MKKFPPDELLEFLSLVDEELPGETDLVIAGGAAIAIAYSVTAHVTGDIDVLHAGKHFWNACEAATKHAKKQIPVSQRAAGIAALPMGYEERQLLVEKKRFKNLNLFVPERHDLAMMKIGRGDEHDLAGLEDVHKAAPFDLDTLIERYWETVEHRIGRADDFRYAFLSLVERLFSDRDVERAKKETKAKPR